MKTLPKKPLLKASLITCGLVVSLSAFVHPSGQVRSVTGASQDLLQGSGASPAVRAIMERSCQGCHSEKTQWPWYSYVVPVSWMIESDVSTARHYMNLTRWPSYTPGEKIGMLSAIAPLVSNRVMPPERYIALHPDAKLSAAEIDQLARWAREERRIIAGPSTK